MLDRSIHISRWLFSEDKQFAAKAAEGNFNFLRTNAAYKRAIEFAYKRFKWVERGLK